ARLLATSAMRSFAARGKPVNAALARAAALRAQLAGGNTTRASLRSALAAAEVLETAGLRQEGLRTRLLAAPLSLAVPALADAHRQLGLAQSLQRRGTMTDRIALRHVRAMLLIAENDVPAAERELELGLRLLDEYSGALGAIELRAGASGIGTELAKRGLAI